MKRILFLLLALVLVISSTAAQAFRLAWDPAPVRYVDNTAIEPANLPLQYDAWQDGTPIATGTTATFAPLADNTYGATHVYKIRTRLKDGRVSDNAVVSLQSPFDSRLPKGPAAPYRITD